MVVPTVIPMTVGASTIDTSQSATYAGSFLSYPIIRITGPITDCIITNTSTGEILDFTGLTIAAGDYREIDCSFEHKTVVDSSGVNKLSDLVEGSDLATFHIADDLEVLSGVNSISVSGSAVTLATRIDITYFTRFIGR
jgi:phage-related protein